MTRVDEPLLRLTDVVKDFTVGAARHGLRHERLTAVNRVSVEVQQGETLGVVGESGCGKSTLARAIVGLTPISSGRIEFDGADITNLSRRRMRPVRRQMQMVFQDPYASLNPRRRVGDIVAEPMKVHGISNRASVRRRVGELFELVGLSARHVDRFPHEFSGGQRQRVGIARALALNPRLIIADEPVSALDVSIQAQVLNLFADLQDQLGLTYVFIAHDLGVVRHMSQRIAVMYLGEIVELAEAETLYANPAHPYSEALLSAIPEVDDGTVVVRRERIILHGDVPNPIDMPTGCPFAPRCPRAQEHCHVVPPVLRELPNGTMVSCHYPSIVTPSPELSPGENPT